MWVRSTTSRSRSLFSYTAWLSVFPCHPGLNIVTGRVVCPVSFVETVNLLNLVNETEWLRIRERFVSPGSNSTVEDKR